MNINDKKIFSELIDSFLRRNYSPKIRTRFYAWLLGAKNRGEKEKVMQEKFESYDIPADENVHRSLMEVHKRIGFSESQSETKRVKMLSMHRRLLRIAAVVIPVVILTGAGFYFSFSKNTGTTGNKHPEYLSLALANEKQQITLPDSSKVWVNSGSTIRYPKDNTQDKRLVELSGEAYFVVEKDADKPFLVKTNHLSVVVTGTEFNVKEVKDAGMTVITLAQGKINVETDKKESFSLIPGQQLKYYHLTGKTEITGLDTPAVENTAIWRSDRLQFEDITLRDMLSGIEIYYNVKIDYSALSVTDNRLYTIRFSQGEDLTSTMNVLKELVSGFNYRIEGQIIYTTDN